MIWTKAQEAAMMARPVALISDGFSRIPPLNTERFGSAVSSANQMLASEKTVTPIVRATASPNSLVAHQMTPSVQAASTRPMTTR